jgi:hypothetical protein
LNNEVAVKGRHGRNIGTQKKQAGTMSWKEEEQQEGVLESIATFFFGKKLTPEDMVKKWKQELASQRRLLDRQIRSL